MLFPLIQKLFHLLVLEDSRFLLTRTPPHSLLQGSLWALVSLPPFFSPVRIK